LSSANSAARSPPGQYSITSQCYQNSRAVEIKIGKTQGGKNKDYPRDLGWRGAVLEDGEDVRVLQALGKLELGPGLWLVRFLHALHGDVLERGL
jgi:hypothetical protein